MGFVHSVPYYLAYLTVDLSFRPRLEVIHIFGLNILVGFVIL
jgi:hypothetical protein